MGNDPPGGLWLAQLEDRVVRPSCLECTNLLEVFAFEKKVRATADSRVERFAAKHRGTVDESINASMSRPHVRKGGNGRGSGGIGSKDGRSGAHMRSANEAKN